VSLSCSVFACHPLLFRSPPPSRGSIPRSPPRPRYLLSCDTLLDSDGSQPRVQAKPEPEEEEDDEEEAAPEAPEVRQGLPGPSIHG